MRKHNPYLLTEKQTRIMREVIAGNTCPVSGSRLSDLDLDQLIERLTEKYADYAPSKQAIQFSIRYLHQKGLLDKSDSENRRGRRRRLLSATPLGIQLVLPGKQVEFDPNDQPGLVVEGFDTEDLLAGI